MKKIITIALLVLAMVTLSGCGLKFGMEDRKNNGKGETNINKTISIEGINNIDISVGALEATISSYNGDEVKIVGSLGEYVDDLEVNTSGNTISIKDKIFYSSFIGVNFGDNTHSLDIMIPEKYMGDLKYAYGASSTKITDIKVDKLKIEGGAGELIADNIVFNNLDLNAGVGSTKLYLKEKCGDINAKGGVGEVYIDMREVGGNLIYDGGVGSAEIRIPVDSPVRINTKSGLGQSNIRARTSNEGTYTFDLNVGIGEIKVDN